MAEEKLHRHHNLFGRRSKDEEEERIADDMPFSSDDSYIGGVDYSKKINTSDDRDYIHEEADEDYEKEKIEHKHAEHPENEGGALDHDDFDLHEKHKATVCSDCDHKHKAEGMIGVVGAESKEEEEVEVEESGGEKKHQVFERD